MVKFQAVFVKDLFAMIHFTHSTVDHQRPELPNLICPEDPDDKKARSKAVVDNPALAD